MTADAGEVLDLVEDVLAHWSWDNPHTMFGHKGMTIRASWVDGTDEEPPQLTLVVPNGLELAKANYLRMLAYEAVTGWFSEATNNDACDVEIKEISAHFNINPETMHWVDEIPEDSLVIVARVHDWLS